jgi:hypothetical protein
MSPEFKTPVLPERKNQAAMGRMGREMGSQCLMSMVSACEDEKVLEVDGGKSSSSCEYT